MFKWYAFRTQTGREQKVKEAFEKLRVEYGLEDRITRILVPTQVVPKVRKGKRVIEEKPIFRGYVLVEIRQDSEDDPVVGDIIKLLANAGVAMPILAKEKVDRREVRYTYLTLTDEEVQKILQTVEEEAKKKEMGVPFMVGERVKVVDGPFKGMEGLITELYPERDKMKVEITFFGRVTSVILDFVQVERVSGR